MSLHLTGLQSAESKVKYLHSLLELSHKDTNKQAANGYSSNDTQSSAEYTSILQ